MRIDILFKTCEIQEKVKNLAHQIDIDYKYMDKEIPILLCVLKGSLFFYTDLCRYLGATVRYDFVQLSSYKDGTEAGEISLLIEPVMDLTGKEVIIVEDIVDTGNTISYLQEYLISKRGASKVKVCSLLNKECRREQEVHIDYKGFDIDDYFVIGYGLDHGERYRNLPYIGHFTKIKQSKQPEIMKPVMTSLGPFNAHQVI